MNEITVFQNEEFGDIRTVIIDGAPWFVGIDVCRALDIRNNRDAMSRLDDDEKGVEFIDTPGGRQKLSIVNESGIYALVLGPTLSPAELLVAQANLLLEQEQRVKALEIDFDDMKDNFVDINDRMEQLESVVVNHPEDYVSVAGYARMKNIPLSLSVAQHLGRKAKKLSLARGAEIYQTGDERFGTVGTYRIDILDDVFAAYKT